MADIQQAVMLVVDSSKTKKWYRLSRSKFPTLVNNLRNNYPNFYYAKIYEIVNYKRSNTKKGIKHQIGNKIAFITLTSSDLNTTGIYDSAKAQKYKQDRNL